MTARRLAAALACALASCGARAEDVPARWYLQIDNDVVFVTDRWFTSAVRVARVSRTNGRELELGLIHEVYTPEQRNWEPGRADRLPTGRLLLDAAQHRRAADTFDTFEVQLGVRGKSAYGRQTTQLVHRAIPSEEVDWSRQLPDRFDASLVVARSASAPPFRVHIGGVLGTQIAFAHLGTELRYGPGSRDIDFHLMRFAATPPFAARKDGLGWSVFAGASARLVAHNRMIAGNYDPGGPGIHESRAIGRIAAGAAWTLERGSVTFSLVHDTREFREQRKPQEFGSLAVHWDF